METFLETRCHDADHALVPLRIEEDERAAVAFVRYERRERALLHFGFDRAAFAIERVELARDVLGAARVVSDEAFDAERHVGETPCRVEARAEHEPQLVCARASGIARRRAKQ